MRIIQNKDVRPYEELSKNDNDWIYNALDCCVTMEIFEELEKQLDNVAGSTYAFSKSMQGPVMEMATSGVLVNRNKRAKVLANFERLSAKVEANLNRIIKEGVGVENLNWRSPAQLGNLLYDIMGLPEQKKRGANGKFTRSTNRESVEKLTIYHIALPIAGHILFLRDLEKKIQFLRTGIDSDGRMRTSYNIAGTDTGRLSSAISDLGTGTNMQNIDRELRSIFVSDTGWKFANLDLEQGDSRNVGAICWNLFVHSMGEAYAGSYLDACESGDLHTSVAKMVWPGLAWTGVLKEDKAIAEQIFYRQDSYRQMAKKGGHGTNYYGTPPTMAKHLKVERQVIKDFQINYFSGFPVLGSFQHDTSLPNWHNYVRNQLIEYSSLTTLLGRRRYFFGRPDDDATLRKAIAYEPQSLTADEIDTGMIRLWRTGRIRLMLQVHDSILIQYREEEENEIVPWALETLRVPIILEKGREFVVPTEAKIGWNWGEHSAENPDGLIKWKGQDSRKRTERNSSLSVTSWLSGS